MSYRPARLALLVLGLLSTAAHAQTASLSGFVRDAETGETLLQATVRVASGAAEGRGAATNAEGFYSLGGLAPGEVSVVASYLGYNSRRLTVTLEPGGAARLDFELRPEGLQSDEVVVEADETLENERPPGVQNVSIDLVEALPTVFEADLFRSIQLLPGVKAANDFSSALYIRGGSPDQTLVLLDGTTVYNPTHFFGFFSTFNTDAIKDVRLYKGAYPSQYGGRLGSVVDIYNRDGNRNERKGSLTLGLLASRAGVEGPIGGGKASYSLNVRRSTLEPLLGVLREQLDEDGIPESFFFYDINGKVGVDLTPNDRISVAAYAGRDQVVVPFGDDARFDLDYGNRTGSITYNRVLSGTAFASAQVSGTRYFSYPVGTIAETEFRQPNTITEYAAQVDAEWLPSEQMELRVGGRAGSFALDFESEFNGTVGTSFSNPATFGAAYVQGRSRFGDGWTVTGGLRLDAFRNRADDRLDDDPAVPATYVRFAPHAQVERSFNDQVVVQAAAGRYHQFLSLVSNEAFSGFDTWLTTGPGVGPQASEQAVVGVKSRLGPNWRLDVEVYGRTLRELFDTRPELSDVAGLGYADLFRFGKGYAYGTEILLERGAGRLTGLLGYTLGVTRRRYPLEPAFTSYFPPKYDRLHDVTLVANYDLGRGWRATLAGAYATGQAYTVPDRIYRVAGGPIPALNVLDSESLNNTRLPPYHRVDVGFTKRGAVSIADYELQLQLVNVYNRRNLWFETYDFDENPVQVGQVRQLPILPNISLSLDF